MTVPFIPISLLPNLDASDVTGGDLIPLVDPTDLSESATGTTKRSSLNSLVYPPTVQGDRTSPTLAAYLANNTVYNALDFGCSGDGTTDDSSALNTLANITIPSGNGLYLPPGRYFIGSNLTLPAGLPVSFAPGAVLVVADGVTVTILGQVVAARSQIFDTATGMGTGVVRFGSVTQTEWFYPQWWGASGDGISDDGGAINKMMAAVNNGYAVDFGASYAYFTTETIQIGYGICVRMPGSHIRVGHDGIGVLCQPFTAAGFGPIGANQTETPLCIDLDVRKVVVDQATGSVGVKITNSSYGQINLKRTTGFETSHILYASIINGGPYAGFSYNEIILNNMGGCRYGQKIDCVGGYVNENTYFGGQFAGTSHSDSTFSIVRSDTFNLNQNVWVRPCIEGLTKVVFDWEKMISNVVISPRMEMPQMDIAIKLSSNCQSNVFFCSFGFSQTAFNSKISDLGTYNKILTTVNGVGQVELNNRVCYIMNAPNGGWGNGIAGWPVVSLGNPGVVAVSGVSGAVTLNAQTGDMFSYSLSGNVTAFSITTPTATPNGKILVVTFNQGASGNTISGFSGIAFGNWPGPVARASGSDVYILQYIGGWKVIGWNANNGRRLFPILGANVGDADITLNAQTSNDIIRYESALTANRTITLPTTGLYDGLQYTILRTGLGVGSLAIGSLLTIPPQTPASVEIVYSSNAGAWRTQNYTTLPTATMLASSSVTLNNGAGANAGTLTNAPVAGDPTKWIPINDNGTTRYIPAW